MQEAAFVCRCAPPPGFRKIADVCCGMGRLEAVALFLIGGAAVAIIGQSSSDARIQSQLKQLFPSATAFSP